MDSRLTVLEINILFMADATHKNYKLFDLQKCADISCSILSIFKKLSDVSLGLSKVINRNQQRGVVYV